ncbi:MAG: tyrosine decarboxylase MfnA [Candidatus Bathyarchaeota archaeon]|nr:MAG: tyrosine decarboxylase MfnA [Candidatus Bathyarchaeota archaeon]
MDENGLPSQEILRQLQDLLKEETGFNSGRIMGSMCTSPHLFAQRVYRKYVDKNLGDPGLFPATAQLETEVVRSLGSLLSNPSAVGNIVTGGTEANLLALWACVRSHSDRRESEVLVPSSVHCSFEKIADLLGLRLVKVKLNEHFQVDVAEVRRKITSRTLALIGIAGTTGLGVLDPIYELSQLAQQNNLYLHVDAAFGGFVLPFLNGTPPFDFRLPGVSSITIDPHKMGLAPIPAGGILFRDRKLHRKLTWTVPYLSGGETSQTTFVGSRSGASVIAVWAMLKHFGKAGYRKIVGRCMKLTMELAREIDEIPELAVVVRPTINVIGVKSNGPDLVKIVQSLREMQWAVALFPRYMRIVIMPHVHKEHLNQFVQDLRQVVVDVN